MKIAEAYFNELKDSEKEDIFHDMYKYCPSDFGYIDLKECDGERIDIEQCFKCWMQEVEE